MPVNDAFIADLCIDEILRFVCTIHILDIHLFGIASSGWDIVFSAIYFRVFVAIIRISTQLLFVTAGVSDSTLALIKPTRRGNAWLIFIILYLRYFLAVQETRVTPLPFTYIIVYILYSGAWALSLGFYELLAVSLLIGWWG